MSEHALVTGAASGIGRAIALAPAGRDYRVTATDNRSDALAGLDGSNIDRIAAMDVTDTTAIGALLESTSDGAHRDLRLTEDGPGRAHVIEQLGLASLRKPAGHSPGPSLNGP